MDDSYIKIITALLPLAAAMVVLEVNPYHALIVRGILGAIAVLLYTVLGVPDVALTEALVGTMLAITLYAVAVRSSLVVRLGVIQDLGNEPILDEFRKIFSKYHLRLELISYQDQDSLQQALIDKDIHLTCIQAEPAQPYETLTRIQRLYEIMEPQLSASITRLTYIKTPPSGEK
ncbi:DUF4040 domain-containing protein [Planktothrix agardhii]|jgi:putative multicomponent Na+:H+ antiporter subunit B|uniref:DUF4040 domain-containing protein n=1 Tax=Planktothrix agardhii TaxID=1160 RepID=UPI001D0AB549|nr:DUF4040 domain-containing protein [Planktothrix agardhii]MCB8759556.1 DUF4040 domain-containing protein [Planktothrix agardhii 1813]